MITSRANANRVLYIHILKSITPFCIKLHSIV